MAKRDAKRTKNIANSAYNAHQKMESQTKEMNRACLAKAETDHDSLSRFASISAALRNNRNQLEASATQVTDRVTQARQAQTESTRSKLRYHDAVKARSAFSTLIERIEKRLAAGHEIADEDALMDVHMSKIGRKV